MDIAIRNFSHLTHLALKAFSNIGTTLRPSALRHIREVLANKMELKRQARRLSGEGVDNNKKGGSKRDMSTGPVSVDRGFDFAVDERGVHMRRVQMNLSEKKASRSLGVGGSGEGQGR
jgi:hypothetical protein